MMGININKYIMNILIFVFTDTTTSQFSYCECNITAKVEIGTHYL